MQRKVYNFLAVAAAVLLAAGCSGDDEAMMKARVQGKITVADSIDSSQNYEGIGVTIIQKDSANADADTLFSAKTNKQGEFSGTAEFLQHRQYPLIISRNGQNISQLGVILAKDDTVNISAELPGIAQTLDIQSHEHKALETYQRIEKNFQRVGAFARAGRLTGDSLATELKKWPGIYWQVYEKSPETIAGQLAAKKSIELLSQMDQSAMMEKLNQIDEDEDLVYLAASYGKQYKAKNESLDEALSYLKNLESSTQNANTRMRIQMERIDLLYDSLRTEEARKELKSFRQEFSEDSMAKEWAASVEYDLNYLSPGDAIPDFSFTDGGKTISREKLKGTPYLLEITSLRNPLYQQQYDRSVVIYSIYKNYDFQIVTIPLDSSKVTVNAFFEERMRPWPVAPASAFDVQKLIKRFNIQHLPVRFLVDKQGRIVRRFEGREYDDIIQEIQKIIKTN